MKKRVLGMALAAVMSISLFAGTAMAEEADLSGKKVGLSFMNTADPVIAELITRAREAFDEKGIEVLVSDAGGDSSTQIDAVENFKNSGCEVVVIQAIDTTAMSGEAQKLMDDGVKVIAYGMGIDNYDLWYRTDNTEVGTAIGEMAAEWINDQLGGEAKIEVIGFPMVDVLIERADAIKAVLEEQCPNAEIVAEVSAIDSETGYSQTETVLAAHPDLNCIVSISDGPACGAYEAVKANGLDGDNFGVFGSDLSNVALQYIADGTSYRGSTDIDVKTGGGKIAQFAINLMTGEEMDDIINMNVTKVSADNVADYLE